jgi:adenylate cyclase
MEPSILSRLKQRKLVQWALAYLAAAWLVLQVTDVIGTQFAWPVTLMRSITVLLATGLFATLVIAWYHGEKGYQRVSGIELLMLAGILVVAGAAVTAVRHDAAAPAGATEATRERPARELMRAVAVLPFTNHSTDPENAFFAAGVHEEVLTQLSKVGDLKVISLASVLRYADDQRDVREIGRTLGVGRILEGSVQRAAGRVRISIRLIDATSEQQLWAERYDRDLDDIFSIQSEVALEIARQLNATISATETERVERRPTDNLIAYDLYLKGRQAASIRSQDGLLQAVRYFEEVIQLDASFASAWSGLADSYTLLALYGFFPPGEAWPSARAAAEQALKLDPNSAEAHTSLGKLLDESGDWQGAEPSYRRAIELRPSYAPAHQWYGMHLTIRGRVQEGLLALQRASDLDPLSQPIGPPLSMAYTASGEHESAIDVARRTIQLAPAAWGGYLALAGALVANGQVADAVSVARSAEELAGGNAAVAGTAGAVYARAGQVERAREVIAQLETNPAPGTLAAQALIHANLGQRDTAFALLDRESGWNTMNLLAIRTSSVWSPLRTDPRWPMLLRRLGIEHERPR